MGSNEMKTQPHVYIHQIGPWGERYLDEENLALLGEFASFTNDSMLEETPNDLEEKLSQADGILSLNGVGTDAITADLLKRTSSVKVAAISHWFHGLHDGAVPQWKNAGLTVIDSSDGNNYAVAQWTLGAIITGLFRFAELDRAMRAGEEWPEHEDTSSFLDGQRIGIVGLGRIGRLVAKLLGNFNVELVGYDAYVDAETAQAYGVEKIDLDELMTTSDIITFHLPVTDETKRLVTRRHIESIKDGALVVNSARTAVLEYDAFIDGLKQNRFRAVVDVFEPEPPPLDDPTRTLPNIVTTPHIAGSTRLMCKVSGRTAILALKGFFENAG